MLKNNEEVEKLEMLESKSEGEINFETENEKIIGKEISLEVDLEDKEQQDSSTVIEQEIDSTMDLKRFNINNLEKPKTKDHQMRVIEKADFSVVNTNKNGQRVKVSKELCKAIGKEELDTGTIDIAFLPHGVVLSKDLLGIGERFQLRKGGHIYSKDLVEEITKRFKLDFNNGVTTRSFSNPQYQKLDNGCIVAIVEI